MDTQTFLESPYFGSVVCLCGSTQFKEAFEYIAEWFTWRGAVVLMPCIFHHADNVELTNEQKNMLDLVHRLKIKNADLIFIVDQDHYIGKSTQREIEFATTLNKNIIYWSDMRI